MIKIEDFSPENLEYLVKKSDGDIRMGRDIELRWLMDRCKDDENSLFIELGVYKAHTISVCAEKKPHQIFHGFDSFEGLPEEWFFSEKKIYPKGKAKHKSFWLDKLPKALDNVVLHKGWFSDTLPKWKSTVKSGQYISFLHMDADLYSSTYEGFEILNDLIVKDTIIKFDELTSWNLTFSDAHKTSDYENWREGEFKALNDWLTKYNRKVKPLSRDSHQAGTVIVTQ